MLEKIITCFKNDTNHILSAKNLSKTLGVKLKVISVILNNNPEFIKTEFCDTGCGKFRTNTFKLVA
jgi:hypothetical protein